MLSQVLIIDYNGYKIRHFADAACGLELVFMHTEDTGELVLTQKIRPAIGGCRRKPGLSLLEACEEVYGLATEMAAKMKDAGLNGAGAKIVVFGQDKSKSECVLHAIGNVVEYLNRIGIRYITSVDVGTTPDDVAIIGQRTPWVSHCNPSSDTACGVKEAILAYRDMFFATSPEFSVFVKGLGEVGYNLALMLREQGVIVYGSDKYLRPDREAKLKEIGVHILPAIEDSFPQVDVFAPCAMGGDLTETSIPLIEQAGIYAVIGSANHQCKNGEPEVHLMHKLGVLWAIDHVVNRCGLLRVATEFPGLFNFHLEDLEREIVRTGTIVRELFEMSLRDKIDMLEAERRYFGNVPLAA